ncbi:MAG: 50S ribosomal protein L23 [Holosporales bacterium]|jgi:large subunit ribosomal protein L23|nr:50S ribosomal protein L23 [Holosporales bacterium]
MASNNSPRVVFNDYSVLRYPVITEKSNLAGDAGQYFFVVDKGATKADIKHAVERVFNVSVVSVNTLIRKGKSKTFRGRKARLSDQKRAVVRLAPGQSIVFVAGV